MSSFVELLAPAYCTSTGPRCITAADSSCRPNGVALPDGDYQACEGCTFYHSCVAGQINYAFRSCAATNEGGINGLLVWDDNLKRCEYESNTCRQCYVSESHYVRDNNEILMFLSVKIIDWLRLKRFFNDNFVNSHRLLALSLDPHVSCCSAAASTYSS
jgi:hypothetical protein